MYKNDKKKKVIVAVSFALMSVFAVITLVLFINDAPFWLFGITLAIMMLLYVVEEYFNANIKREKLGFADNVEDEDETDESVKRDLARVKKRYNELTKGGEREAKKREEMVSLRIGQLAGVFVLVPAIYLLCLFITPNSATVQNIAIIATGIIIVFVVVAFFYYLFADSKNDSDNTKLLAEMIRTMGAKNILSSYHILYKKYVANFDLIRGKFKAGDEVVLLNTDWLRVGKAKIKSLESIQDKTYEVSITNVRYDELDYSGGFCRIISGVDETK